LDEVPAEIQLFVGKKLGTFKDEVIEETSLLKTKFAVIEQKFSNLRLMILTGLGVIEATVYFIMKVK
jgi:hypothetical protein